MGSTLQDRVREASEYNQFATPSYGTEILIPYLKQKGFQYAWEPACGLGHISKVLEENDINVFQSDINIFKGNEEKTHKLDFTVQTELPDKNIEAIITNPPYSIKDDFIKKCYEFGKPFALLMTVRALGAKDRVNMYMEYGIELLVPDRRINYIYHLDKERNWFHSAWFCHGILPEKIIFTRMQKHDRDQNQIRFY